MRGCLVAARGESTGLNSLAWVLLVLNQPLPYRATERALCWVQILLSPLTTVTSLSMTGSLPASVSLSAAWDDQAACTGHGDYFEIIDTLSQHGLLPSSFSSLADAGDFLVKGTLSGPNGFHLPSWQYTSISQMGKLRLRRRHSMLLCLSTGLLILVLFLENPLGGRQSKDKLTP